MKGERNLGVMWDRKISLVEHKCGDKHTPQKSCEVIYDNDTFLMLKVNG